MKGVILETKNKKYKMRFSINAQVEIEDLLGVSMFDLLVERSSITRMRTLVCIGINHGEGVDLDYEKTGEIMDEILSKNGLKYLTKKLHDAMEQAYGQVDEGAGTEEEDDEKVKKN